MGKLLKMEFFITLKSKSTFIILLVATCFVTFFTVMMYHSPTGNISSPGDIALSNISKEIEQTNTNTLVDYCENIICSDAIIMFVTIFSALLALQEYKNDYLKNIWTLIGNKKKFILSKIIILAIFILILYILAILAVTCCNLFFMDAEIGDFQPFLKILPIQFLMEIGFGIFTMAVSLLISHTVPAVITCIVYVSFAHTILCSVIDIIINKFLKITDDFKINDYLLYGNVLLIKSDSANNEITRAIIILAIVAILSYVIGVSSLEKKYK